MKLLRLYIRVLALLGSEARLGWALAVANVALASAQFVEPLLFGRIVDALANAQGGTRTVSWSDVIVLVGMWVGFGLFIIGASTMVALHADRLAHRHTQKVRTDYFEHVLQLPLSYHAGTHSGRLMKIMLTGTNTLWALWLSFFRENLTSFVSLLILMPLTLLINWRFGLLLILLCLIFAVLIAFVLHHTEKLQRQVESHYTDMAERTTDTFGNIALIQSFARVESEVSLMRTVGDKLLGAQMPVLSWWALAAVLSRTSTTLTMLAILVVGIFLYLAGLSTVGEIVMFMSFATLLIGKLESVVYFTNHIVMDAPRLQEYFDVLDTVPAVRDRPDAMDAGRLHGLIEFDNVTYSYDGKRPAVEDLHFTALPGETIALVGATGAGKSTALGLLHRVFDPQSGKIKIDGMDIRALTLSALRRNIGVVFQEALLFNRTIQENLQVGKPDASDEEMREACQRAQALEIIEHNPEGFLAQVGERGRLLSGGERQRISIARALLKNPPILILDEATSALDALTEAKVQAALDEVMKGRTTFVIAHRLATIRNATRILVFAGGRIVESGNFDELVRQGGRFAELARTQFMVAETAKPDTAKPDTAKPDTAKPDTAKPDTAKPDSAKPATDLSGPISATGS
jgi:glucan exporter ATP-binding protein